jgi:hypothetical protein
MEHAGTYLKKLADIVGPETQDDEMYQGFMRWLVCLTKQCSVAGRPMRSSHHRCLTVRKLFWIMCLRRSSGRTTNMASLHVIWSMTAIAGIGCPTTHWRTPSSTPKSSMIIT